MLLEHHLVFTDKKDFSIGLVDFRDSKAPLSPLEENEYAFFLQPWKYLYHEYYCIDVIEALNLYRNA